MVERLPAGGDKWKLGGRVRVRVESWRGRDLPVPSVGTAIVGRHDQLGCSTPEFEFNNEE